MWVNILYMDAMGIKVHSEAVLQKDCVFFQEKNR